MMDEILIKTNRSKEVLDITKVVQKELAVSGPKDGFCNLFLTHTTAALTTADLDPGGTDLDYLDAFEKMIPKIKFHHPHNPEHMPDHILSSLVGVSLTLPVKDGKLVLGTWQKIVLLEFDGPRERNIILTW